MSSDEPAGDDRAPSIRKLYEHQRLAIEQATIKDEAREAIEPILGLYTLYDALPRFKTYPPGGGVIEEIADEVPLTIDVMYYHLEEYQHDL